MDFKNNARSMNSAHTRTTLSNYWSRWNQQQLAVVLLLVVSRLEQYISHWVSVSFVTRIYLYYWPPYLTHPSSLIPVCVQGVLRKRTDNQSPARIVIDTCGLSQSAYSNHNVWIESSGFQEDKKSPRMNSVVCHGVCVCGK